MLDKCKEAAAAVNAARHRMNAARQESERNQHCHRLLAAYVCAEIQWRDRVEAWRELMREAVRPIRDIEEKRRERAEYDYGDYQEPVIVLHDEFFEGFKRGE